MQNKTLPYVKIWHARKFTTSCRCWSRNGDEQTWHQGWLQYCVLLRSHRCQEPLQWLQTTGRSVFTASRSISSIRHYWTWTWASLGLLSLTTSAPCRNSSAAANPQQQANNGKTFFTASRSIQGYNSLIAAFHEAAVITVTVHSNCDHRSLMERHWHRALFLTAKAISFHWRAANALKICN
jgi:hypothetical protein